MDVNIRALRSRASDSEALNRYADVSSILLSNDSATAEHGVQWIRALIADLRIPPLASHGISVADINGLIPRVKAASSMQGNPIALNDEELQTILHRAL